MLVKNLVTSLKGALLVVNLLYKDSLALKASGN